MKCFRKDNIKYSVIKEYKNGKSGTSHLISDGINKFILKCFERKEFSYIKFDELLNQEINAFNKLKEIGVSIPELLEFNKERNYLIKQFIDGKVATELVAENKLDEMIISQLFEIVKIVNNNYFNIDYFPSNFVWTGEKLFYIDYEVQPYAEEWNFENWGIYYWLNSEGFAKY
ncbi:MAG: hypothetical protein JXA68_04200, partial [Ignavibacteriales bacterium]|nr:hypothetical protein [Ignavibacteriales bacterium]